MAYLSTKQKKDDISRIVKKYIDKHADNPLRIKVIDILSSSKIICHFCKKDLSPYSIIILCSKCFDTIIYCLNCLIKRHHKHDYQIIEPIIQYPFTADWSYIDEFTLLNQLEKNSLDNWLPISHSILNKGMIDIEAHYLTFYSQGKLTFRTDKSIRLKKLKRELSLVNTTIPNELQPIEPKTHFEFNLFKRLGYCPKRKEFEVCYCNDIELELEALEFNEDDDDDTLEMKYTVLKNYNRIVEVRERLTEIVIEKDFKEYNGGKKYLSKNERQLIEAFVPLANRLALKDIEALFQNVLIEKMLRQRLNYLRRIGNDPGIVEVRQNEQRIILPKLRKRLCKMNNT